MSYKKWIKITIKYLFTIYIFIISLNYIVNPMQIFEHNLLNNKKYKYTTENAVFKYNTLKKNRFNLIFGTSRSHLVSSKMLSYQTLNLHSIYGYPSNVEHFLFSLNEKQLKNINKIYYLIDLHTLNINNQNKLINYNDTIEIRYNQIKGLVFINIKELISNIFNNYVKQATSYLDQKHGYSIMQNTQTSTPHSYFNNFKFTDSQTYNLDIVKKIIKIQNFCYKHNVKIVFLTPTFPMETLNLMNLDKEYNKINFLLENGLEKIEVLYYIPNISDLIIDKKYLAFTDPVHLNYKYQEIIMNTLLHDKYEIKNKKILKEHFRSIRNSLRN